MKNTVTFKTETQKLLFGQELQGQISDGHWENSSPNNHWEGWCRADVLVGEKVGVNFYPIKNNYNFCNSVLLECVGERMVRMVGFKMQLPQLSDTQCEFLGCYSLDFLIGNTNDYWVGKIAKVLELVSDKELLKAESNINEFYTMKDLKKDLKEMKKTIKIFNG